jgi:hypothetical protein
VVQTKVLEKIDDSRLKVFVVWTPRLLGDSRDKALDARNLITDKRATQFWDSTGWLGKGYGKTLSLPGKRTFAWDVYLAFDMKAKWEKEPPTPTEWMHQLGGNEERRLDGDQLRQVILKLLGAKGGDL